MMTMYTPLDWHWIVGSDVGRAWSSRQGAYVPSWPADRVTKIANVTELSDVLRPYGLALPLPTAADVRAEADRRIDERYPLSKRLDGQARATELLVKGVSAWSASDAAEATALQAMRDWIEHIRTSSDDLIKAVPATPVDYRDDQHWQS